MSRSVSIPRDAIPRDAIKVAYADADATDSDPDFGFDDAVDNLRWAGQRRYPSLQRCSVWVSREDRAILENDLAYITLSEYNGLVAICAVPKGEGKKAAAWCVKADLADLAGYFGPVLISKGRFSNGEQVFIRADLANRETISSNGSRW